jgi:tyrosyl-tRNA synthetase
MIQMNTDEIEKGIPAYILFEQTGLCKTRSDARRLLSQGGGYINGKKIENFDQIIDRSSVEDGSILIRAGKKRFMKVSIR